MYEIYEYRGTRFAVGAHDAYLFSNFFGCWIKTPNFNDWAKYHSVKPTGETITKLQLSGITK